MNSHDHHDEQQYCEHKDVRYCKVCQVVYCRGCGKEWKETPWTYSYTYPQILYGRTYTTTSGYTYTL